jgi:hypothetical protein
MNLRKSPHYEGCREEEKQRSGIRGGDGEAMLQGVGGELIKKKV